jgi:Cu-Zn family superoxide dismutase
LGVETLDQQNRSFHHAFSLELNYNPEFALGKLSFGWDAYCRRSDGHGQDQFDQCHWSLSDPLGMASFVDSPDGLVITPKLSGLPPGEHGFHIHDKGDCGPGMNQGKPAAGFAAGGHYDPAHTQKHLGPLSTAGHRGDLPVLVVDDGGDATKAVVAPHLTVEQIRGRAIMIHTGGDNYSDTPVPLGGGGARIACGVIY